MASESESKETERVSSADGDPDKKPFNSFYEGTIKALEGIPATPKDSVGDFCARIINRYLEETRDWTDDTFKAKLIDT
ncbi:uncharacterized protein L199_001248 [Kwoniella botswanensis]|uniref:uncharacterized protein n=1 Tax=Kwoniella botswanensis TaxID=1268659 RepID=UPI00315CFC97